MSRRRAARDHPSSGECGRAGVETRLCEGREGGGGSSLAGGGRRALFLLASLRKPSTAMGACSWGLCDNILCGAVSPKDLAEELAEEGSLVVYLEVSTGGWSPPLSLRGLLILQSSQALRNQPMLTVILLAFSHLYSVQPATTQSPSLSSEATSVQLVPFPSPPPPPPNPPTPRRPQPPRR